MYPKYLRRRGARYRPLIQLLTSGGGQSHECWQEAQDSQHAHRCILSRLLQGRRRLRPLRSA